MLNLRLAQLVLEPIWQVYQALQDPSNAPALLSKVVDRLSLQVPPAIPQRTPTEPHVESLHP